MNENKNEQEVDVNEQTEEVSVAEVVVQNTKETPVTEAELDKFNWGAFGLSIFWGIGNKAYLTLLCLIPVFNIAWMFVCGFKGNEWAYKNGDYTSVEEFNKVQKTWKVPGIVATVIRAVSVLLYTMMFIFFVTVGIFAGIQEGISSYDDPYAYEEEYSYRSGSIEDVPGWTQTIYTNIKLAEYVSGNEQESYKNGSSYPDLVKEVGEPVSTYRNGNTVSAEWESDDYNTSITIDYDVLTNQIISKDIY